MAKQFTLGRALLVFVCAFMVSLTLTATSYADDEAAPSNNHMSGDTITIEGTDTPDDSTNPEDADVAEGATAEDNVESDTFDQQTSNESASTTDDVLTDDEAKVESVDTSANQKVRSKQSDEAAVDKAYYGVSHSGHVGVYEWVLYESGQLVLSRHGYGYFYCPGNKAPWDRWSFDITSFRTEGTIYAKGSLASLFENCYNLKRADLSSFNTSKVTNMNSMFSGCGSLTYVDVKSFNTSHVKDMRDMFFACNSLRSLNLTSFYTKQHPYMDGMLWTGDSLEKIAFGKNFAYIDEADMYFGVWKNRYQICDDYVFKFYKAPMTEGLWVKTKYSNVYMEYTNRGYRLKADPRAYLKNTLYTDYSGNRYYFGSNGYASRYRQYIDGGMYYFDGRTYEMCTGIVTWKNNHTKSYFDPYNGGKASTNRWISYHGKKYYMGSNGYSVKYRQHINGGLYYFNSYCQQQTGVVIWNNTGKLSYFDPRQGGKASTNRWISYHGKKYYLDKYGYSTHRVY